MPAVTVRNLPEETHRAIKRLAEKHGRSTEAEIREILEEVVRPESRVKIGTALAAFGERLRDMNFDTTRDQTPTDAASFE